MPHQRIGGEQEIDHVPEDLDSAATLRVSRMQLKDNVVDLAQWILNKMQLKTVACNRMQRRIIDNYKRRRQTINWPDLKKCTKNSQK